jgi:transglycosylase-like protein with SLT domain
VGALVAVAVAAVATILPRTLGESSALPRIETFISSACGGTSPCPSPERLEGLRRLDTLLAERMRGLPESDRIRLADVIYEEATGASLDPFFVLAVIAVESGFDHAAESERGARGLMQLRPSTLRGEAARSRLELSDPDDPILNVRAGVRYFRRLVRAFGSTDLALMAYNAGPNRILRYLEEEGAVPERFLAYPQKVNGELRRLKRRQAATQLALADVAPAARPSAAEATAADAR